MDEKQKKHAEAAQKIKAARLKLGLSTSQMAAMLDTDPQSMRRYEMMPTTKSGKPPAARMQRLADAYLSGYRPPDWPEEGRANRTGPIPKNKKNES